MRGLIGALGAAMLLSGCTSITTLGNTFEGAADFKVVPLEDGKLASSKPIRLDDIHRFQQHPDAKAYQNADRFFEADDYIQVSLKSGTIGWFSEGAEQHLANKIADVFSESKTKGEIAIIANVTEGKRRPGSLKADGTLGFGTFGDNNMFVVSVRKVNEGPDIASDVELAELTESLKTAGGTDLRETLQTLSDLAIRKTAYRSSLNALKTMKENPAEAVRQLEAERIVTEMQCSLLVSSNADATVIGEVCGERAEARQMDKEAFIKLSRRLLSSTCLKASDLSKEALITSAPTADALKTQRDAIVPLMKVKTDEQSCSA